jgi:hypothetical protein
MWRYQIAYPPKHPRSLIFLPKLGFVLCFVVLGSVACQPTKPVPSKVTQKAEAYLRSQLKLTSNSVTVEAQAEQPINKKDICQTTEPAQVGFVIVFVAEGSRYKVHSDRGGNKIEICTAQDAQADTFEKYTGAGYTVKYPQSWQVVDEGLEPNGANRVQFLPKDRTQGYLVVQRISPQSVAELITSKNLKNFKEEKFDATSMGASSGSKQEYIEMVVVKSGQQKEWQVKALLLKNENFVYKLQLFYSGDKNPLEKDFEQFTRDFQLIK